MKNHLPKVTSAELTHLMRNARLIENVDAMRRDIARAANYLPTVGFVALARKRHPDLPVAAAFDAFMVEVADFIAEARAIGSIAVADLDEEEKRLAPVVAAAARRDLEIQRRVENIDKSIATNKSRRDEKRKKLIAAGLNLAEVNSHTATEDTSNLSDERAELLTEGGALQEFLRTRDERTLPEGFAEKVREAA